ncbi:MAG: proton-conducting transporter membrane subunit [Gemmatimonadota bacterium]
MSPQTAAVLAVLLPFAGAGLVLALGRWPNLREGASLLTAGALFATVYSLVGPVRAGGVIDITLWEVMPGVRLALNVEPLGLLFALVASFLWIVTTVYSIGYMRGHHEKNQTRFYAFFAISIAAAMGVAFSANLFTIFAFYEALTLATFPLVTHHQTDAARRAGRVYLGILLFTSICFQLLAIIWSWQLAGTLEFRPGGFLAGTASPMVLSILLALYIFGVGKAAVMPFHRWLPAAMVAPTPVSALLHAVAVVKAGVFTILKVVIYVFGLDLVASLAVTPWLAWAAAATIILGSLVAFTKDNLKARLAYSTISQLSYIVLGALLANAYGIVGGGMHIAMHAFGKITLFFAAGAVLVAAHETDISRMKGLGRSMPITFGAFFVGSLSIIGVPPAGGSWSKWFLGLGTLEAHQIGLLAVLMLSSLLSLVYLLEVPVKAFFSEPPEDAAHAQGFHEAPWPSVLALVITAIGTMTLFLFPGLAYDLMTMVVSP